MEVLQLIVATDMEAVVLMEDMADPNQVEEQEVQVMVADQLEQVVGSWLVAQVRMGSMMLLAVVAEVDIMAAAAVAQQAVVLALVVVVVVVEHLT